MANICIVRHQGYIKSKMHFPYQHNFRTLKNYGNKSIHASLTQLNSNVVNNPKNGETYLTAFNRLYESGEFKGQLKVQGAVDKQTKCLDEFLVYPPNEKISEMSLEEQDIFFVRIIKDFLPELIKASPKFIRELLDNKIRTRASTPRLCCAKPQEECESRRVSLHSHSSEGSDRMSSNSI
ncbi:MAG: hypothetical protein E7255_03915 [Lachnospiraceae bacterium]|jgi:hypothetical protein|nr:hypothetical protein [Lachnospiraceae bacterium]